MATEKDEFSARLVKARSTKGWSQLDLSNVSGVAAAQISRYEQGTNTPRPQVIARLANALGVSFPWLLSGAGGATEPSRAGKTVIHIELPTGLVQQLQDAASQNGWLVDQEVQARLEATFDETVVTTVKVRAKPGAEEKRFEFNADEVAEKVAEKLSGKLTMTKPISLDVLKEKYLLPGESSAEDLYRRVARALAFVEGTPGFQSGEAEFQKRDNTPHGPKPSANARKRPPRNPKT